jgi:hypothetical protein
MQGGEMLVESFAQYSALMVMEKEYGRDAMRKFMTYEMDEYLSSRRTERLKELPLAKCEQQAYIHYQKGCDVLFEGDDWRTKSKYCVASVFIEIQVQRCALSDESGRD